MARPLKLRPYAINRRDPAVMQARHDLAWRRRIAHGWFTRFAAAISRITQAFADGANPDDIRKFAGHNNLSTTMGYSRGSSDAIGRVLGMKKKEDGE